MEKIPEDVKPIYDDINSWLDEKLEDWKITKFRPMMFNAHDILASENAILTVPDNINLYFLDILLNLNSDTISFNIYPQVYDKKSYLYDELINDVKRSNKKLVIVYMIDSKTFQGKPTFEDYLQKELNYTEVFIKKYKPDYYGIVVEISTMQKRIGNEFTPGQWSEIIKEVHNLTKSIYPETKTFISLLFGEAKYYIDYAVKLPVDIIAFNIWSPRQLEKLTPYVDAVHKSGKEAWIWMNWWTIQKDPKTGKTYVWFRDCYWQDVDIKWIKAVVFFAQRNNVSMISPFFTEKFVYCNKEYGKPLEDQFRELIDNVKSKTMTKVFYEYKRIIEEVKGAKGAE